MRQRTPHLVVAAVAVAVLTPVLWSHTFFTVSRDDGLLRIVEKGTLVTRRVNSIDPPGATVTRCTAMAFDPTSDVLYVLADLQGQPGSTLLSVGAYSGEATVRGGLGDDFAALTFDDAGVLWAVTDDAAATPETLYTVDTLTGATTFRMTLGGGAPGEGLTFHPGSSLLFRFTGNSPATVETIDPITLARTPFPTTGVAWSETTSTVWDGEANLFRITGGTRSHEMTAAGLVTDSGIDHDHRVFGQAAITCEGAFCGDCNKDGTGPNILDGLASAQMGIDLITPTASQHICCDVNSDFRIGILDALVMAQWSSGVMVAINCPL